MDNSRNVILLGALILLVLYFLKGQKNNGLKSMMHRVTAVVGRHPEMPTLIQLYPDEDDGIAKFIGTRAGQPNQLILDGKDMASEMGLDIKTASYGSVSFDLEKDGYSDLVIAQADGVWVYKNNLAAGRPFSAKKIMDVSAEGLMPYSLVVHDFDRDGNPDFWVMQKHANSGKFANPVILRYQGQYEFVNVTGVVGETKMARILGEINQKRGYLSDMPAVDGNQFIVKVPNHVEFASARVVLVNGRQNIVKYNLLGSGLVQNGTLIFALPPGGVIDKIKIRTIYGKEYNYAEQEIGGYLKVDPMPHFEAVRNTWRSTSMG